MNTRTRIKNMTYIALGAVILTVCSWISVPTPLIPFTLQTFGVYFLIYFFGAKNAFVSLLVYIALGAMGIPVFSSFRSGIVTLLGPTGGYIFGFLASVGVCIAAEPFFAKKRYVGLLVSFLSLMTCYAVGSAWTVHFIEMQNTFFEVFVGSIAAFGAFDCLKLFLAGTLARYMIKITSISI